MLDIRRRYEHSTEGEGMTIQRYEPSYIKPNVMEVRLEGRYVLYTDHLEIVRKLQDEIRELQKEMQRREDYIEGCLV
jgi:hypothetical protein